MCRKRSTYCSSALRSECGRAFGWPSRLASISCRCFWYSSTSFVGNYHIAREPSTPSMLIMSHTLGFKFRPLSVRNTLTSFSCVGVSSGDSPESVCCNSLSSALEFVTLVCRSCKIAGLCRFCPRVTESWILSSWAASPDRSLPLKKPASLRWSSNRCEAISGLRDQRTRFRDSTLIVEDTEYAAGASLFLPMVKKNKLISCKQSSSTVSSRFSSSGLVFRMSLRLAICSRTLSYCSITSCDLTYWDLSDLSSRRLSRMRRRLSRIGCSFGSIGPRMAGESAILRYE